MAKATSKAGIVVRDLESIEDLRKVDEVEKEAWDITDADLTPLTLRIASKTAGNLWLGAFDGRQLVGFAFGFFGQEGGARTVHSHMLAVRNSHRDANVAYQLKVAQRERVLALRVQEVTWTFDPLQSKNAHLNFAKLGVVSASYKIDFYGPETSSILHRNGTDRLWVTWPLASRRVRDRLQGRGSRAEMLDVLSRLTPLVQFSGEGRPNRTDLSAALARQRIAIEIPSDISGIEQKDAELAHEWRLATRWAFTEALNQGFFVAEFCRTIRGQQGPGAYLLEKGSVGEYVPELGELRPQT
jgi:predicted GNAT superfamily acetyltransferase